MLQKFRTSTQIFTQPQPIKSECNAITIINTGTTNARINGVPLTPGDQYIEQGNAGEIDTTDYLASFTGIGTNELTVIRKTYI